MCVCINGCMLSAAERKKEQLEGFKLFESQGQILYGTGSFTIEGDADPLAPSHSGSVEAGTVTASVTHPGVESRANRRSISHRYHLFEVALVWDLTQEIINLPLGCLQGGGSNI